MHTLKGCVCVFSDAFHRPPFRASECVMTFARLNFSKAMTRCGDPNGGGRLFDFVKPLSQNGRVTVAAALSSAHNRLGKAGIDWHR